ncbi:MAG: MaoC family dehydratase [Actinomycetota bacterium]|nr:MaoC family dehydratase [Actinomycetota bacterium]
MRVFADPQALLDAIGERLGESGWHEVTQPHIGLFADATGDHQWIHVDPERAQAGPFGGPIAHGFLTLSMLVPMLGEVVLVEGIAAQVNQGLDKLRFTTPVPVGGKLRLVVDLKTGRRFASRGFTEVVYGITCELDGARRPAYTADFRVLLHDAQS